ncbi:MAG: ShlB/FhaC/HecB family hemolysin secretion/activation protein [Pseudomonadota bacterium]
MSIAQMFFLGFLLFSAQLAAGPLGLPDSARPGAIRPDMKVPEATADTSRPGAVRPDVKVPEGVADTDRPGAVRPEIEGEPEEQIASESQMDIPAMIDRPFDIEEGPYVIVEQFRLVDGEDFPQFDIDIDDVMAVMEQAKQEQPERGFSIGELQEISDRVTRYYRSKGLILSTAVLPVQTVTDGTVDIQIFVGRLGRVRVETNEDYDANVLRRPFLKLIGQPVTQKTIESALLTLTDYPGLSVFGVFEPGIKVGEADIVLKVQEEKWYDVAYRADNHGLQETGRNRFRTIVDWNNPTGFADRITATYQQTYNPKLNDYWALDYLVYLGGGYSAGLGTYKNRFDIGGEFAASNISAETTNDSIYLQKSFIRSRQENLSSRLTMTRKISTTTTSGIQTNQDKLSVLKLEANYDSVDTYHPLRALFNAFRKEPDNNFGGGLNFATVSVSRGFNDIFGAMGSGTDQFELAGGQRASRRGGSGALADGQFLKIEANYQRLQLLTKNTSFLFRTEFQWSKDLLVPLEQYSVGGPENVRGFPDAQGLFDRAYFLSGEYIINAPFFADKPAFLNRTWGEVLQFSIFYDLAIAQQNDPLNTAQDRNTSGKWVTYRSVGAGLRFNVPGMIDSRLMYATGLGPEVPDNNRAGQIWGDFTYSF